jgi:predicted O-methyltransferase YrrM
MHSPRSILLLLRLLLTNPIEFLDRAHIILQFQKVRLSFGESQRPFYSQTISFPDGVRALSKAFGRDLLEILLETELRDIQAHVARSTSALEASGKLPFPTGYNADSTQAQLAYLFSRVLEPKTVLETGVAYGVTSSVILAALHKNGNGVLHSVDLPPIGDRASRAYIGMMIPDEYRKRWRLHFGLSKRLLASLFADGIGEVDLFLHDSANVYQVQKMELEAVWPRLSSPGAVIVNNIGTNTAFGEFVRKNRVDRWFAIEQQEKRGVLTGVILKGSISAD